MRKKAEIIVGLGYGDEGKGMFTDYLCLHSDQPLVVRYNGGQQAGHTVMTKAGHTHMFSNFGAGTLRGVPTYWSKHCTFSPAFFLEEYSLLPIKPKVYLDRSSPVTTHYDVLYNRALEISRGANRHGSCGLGFGATVARTNLEGLSLFVKDLASPSIYLDQLVKIRKFYSRAFEKYTIFFFDSFDHSREDELFIEDANNILSLINSGVVEMVDTQEILSNGSIWNTYIFEGAQGILLDINFGTYPFVTKSNTTSQNALQLIRDFEVDCEVQINYVTRAYHTRHGEGPLNEKLPKIELIKTEDENNKKNKYQGTFRRSYLDVDLVNYALKCDDIYSSGYKKNLLITCLDQFNSSMIPIINRDSMLKVHYLELPNAFDCGFQKCWFSFSPYAEDLT